MAYIPLAILFIFGLIIGSFLNVVILRYGTGMSIEKGRSRCFSCGTTLSWYELIPLVSYVIQGGACRNCRTRISPQYPLVELATGLVFVASYFLVPEAFFDLKASISFILTAALLCLYIVIFVYDIRHKIIPDFFSYSAALVSLLLIGNTWWMTGAIDPWRIIAGPILFIFFWFFWFVSKGNWMGLGDGKLSLSIGWALGLWAGIASTLLSFWIGALISLFIMGFEKVSGKGKLGMKSQIPFAPYLLVGFAIVLLFHIDIQGILAYLAL